MRFVEASVEMSEEFEFFLNVEVLLDETPDVVDLMRRLLEVVESVDAVFDGLEGNVVACCRGKNTL